MKQEFKEIEFRKRINKRNTLRNILNEKKALLNELPEDESESEISKGLKREILEIELRIKQLQ